MFDWISLLIGIGVAAVVAVVTYILKLPSSGIIANVTTGIYSNPEATSLLISITWGVGFPSTTIEKTVYAKNIGNVNSKLTFAQSNFVPAGTNVLVLTTDYNGNAIAPNAVVPIKLTLTIPAITQLAGITNFSFDVNIQATSA